MEQKISRLCVLQHKRGKLNLNSPFAHFQEQNITSHMCAYTSLLSRGSGLSVPFAPCLVFGSVIRWHRLTKRTSRETIDGITSVITDSLAREEKVTLIGFGTFRVMERKARKGVNPQTRETIQIAAKKVPKFVPGKSLRKKVK